MSAMDQQHSRGRGRGQGRGRGRGASSSPKEKRPVGRPRKNPLSTPGRPSHVVQATTPSDSTLVSSNLAVHSVRAMEGDGVHNITMVAQASASAATALMQKVVGGNSLNPNATSTAALDSAGVAGSSNTAHVVLENGGTTALVNIGGSIALSADPNFSSASSSHQLATESGKTGRGRKRKQLENPPAQATTKRPRGRPKGSGVKRASQNTLQEQQGVKKRSRKPKVVTRIAQNASILPKPPSTSAVHGVTGLPVQLSNDGGSSSATSVIVPVGGSTSSAGGSTSLTSTQHAALLAAASSTALSSGRKKVSFSYNTYKHIHTQTRVHKLNVCVHLHSLRRRSVGSSS